MGAAAAPLLSDCMGHAVPPVQAAATSCAQPCQKQARLCTVGEGGIVWIMEVLQLCSGLRLVMGEV